uniref:RING-type domain-containing protein n=3 Tax=Biomphalaria glabrata TaxID=6526 RepID=A0A2C9JBU0_BIOGL
MSTNAVIYDEAAMELLGTLFIIGTLVYGLSNIFLLGCVEFRKYKLNIGCKFFHSDRRNESSIASEHEEPLGNGHIDATTKNIRNTEMSFFRACREENVNQKKDSTKVNILLDLVKSKSTCPSSNLCHGYYMEKMTIRRSRCFEFALHSALNILICLFIFVFFPLKTNKSETCLQLLSGITDGSQIKENRLCLSKLQDQDLLETFSFHFLEKKINFKINFKMFNHWAQLSNALQHQLFQTVSSYTLSVLETFRLATFRNLPMSSMRQNLSVLLLADGGFSYRGQGDKVQCDVCKNDVNLSDFMSGDSMLNPKDPVFHKMQCAILTKGVDSRPTDNLEANNNGLDSDPAPDSETFPTNEYTVPNDTQLVDIDANSYSGSKKSDLGSADLQSNNVTTSDNEGCIIVNGNSQSLPDQHNGNSSSLGAEASPQSYQPQAAEDDGYISDDPNFIDSTLFIPELTNIARAEDFRQPMRALKCDKNPGHFAYFPMACLKLEQLPSKMRKPEFLRFLQLLGMLTVRIVVKETSTDRHKSDPAFKNTDKDNPRLGTGYVSFQEFDLAVNVDKSSLASEHGKWKTVKNYVKTLVKKNSEKLYIETNYHLVFDNFEAVNTTVEFFFDDPTRKNVKAVKCVGMKHSGIPGDSRVVLECKSADQEFISRIHQIKHQLKEVVEKLPRKIKAMMCKKLFIIHHPHGREKHLSYGDSVTVKYIVDKNRHGRNRMTRTNNQSKELNVRKLMQYAADTCPGTSGAPVISFLRGLPDANGSITYHLDIWIHNGEDRKNKLGGASMKELTPEDHLQPHLQSGAEEDSGEEDESSENQTVCAPSLKVLPPANPDFVLYIQRLESYNKLNHKLIHSLKYLAQAGFFYGGYDDCVRCFQCGLGLRSWKEGDNIYEQHQKYKPSCQYLVSQLKDRETIPEDHWLNSDQSDENVTEKLNQTTLNLLKREHKELKQILMCKVCDKEPVKDLFLPCGELCACTGCSKLLTHCPSCKKQIMATVTTYLT